MQITINISKNHFRLFLVLFAVMPVGLAANYVFGAPLLQWHPLSEISADGGATSIESTIPGKINATILSGPMSVSPTGDVSWTGSLTGGAVPWVRLTSFPTACSAGKYVSAIDASSLTCSNPGGGISAGIVLPYAGASAPPGYLLADGTAVSRATYATLFAAIGTTYGAGDGSTTFNLPDLRGRTVVGIGQGAGNGASGTGKPAGTALTNRALSYWSGEETHTLTIAEMPSHTHTVPGLYASGGGGTSGGSSQSTSGTSNPTGGDQPHNNMQPYIALNYIIKY